MQFLLVPHDQNNAPFGMAPPPVIIGDLAEDPLE
jgi:hypothetical protein